MMLTMSTTQLKNTFTSQIVVMVTCNYMNAGKKKIGFILKHDFSTMNNDKSSRQLVI